MTRTKEQAAWRKKHPKYRNARRKANYARSKVVAAPTKRFKSGVRHRPWTDMDIYGLIAGTKDPGTCDKYIAKVLGRSVQAIQQKRYKLIHEDKAEN